MTSSGGGESPSAGQASRHFGDMAPGWRTWDPQFVAMSRSATEAILDAAQIGPGMRVLDIAGGTGEPGLAAARRVGPAGRVTITDLSAAMLATALEKATQQGLKNVTIKEANAEQLPCPDAGFDRVTCRFGVMFFGQLGQALAEVQRVLAPDGRAAFIAWGPLERNPYMATSRTIFARHSPPSPPEPAEPDLIGLATRFAKPGSLTAALREAGFTQVHEEPRTISWPFPGGAEEFWRFMNEFARPAFCPGIGRLSPEALARARAEILAALRPYEIGGEVCFTADIVLASAAR